MFFRRRRRSPNTTRLKSLGVKFTMPPSKVTGSAIAMLDDTCGNLIQIAALDRRQS